MFTEMDTFCSLPFWKFFLLLATVCLNHNYVCFRSFKFPASLTVIRRSKRNTRRPTANFRKCAWELHRWPLVLLWTMTTPGRLASTTDCWRSVNRRRKSRWRSAIKIFEDLNCSEFVEICTDNVRGCKWVWTRPLARLKCSGLRIVRKFRPWSDTMLIHLGLIYCHCYVPRHEELGSCLTDVSCVQLKLTSMTSTGVNLFNSLYINLTLDIKKHYFAETMSSRQLCKLHHVQTIYPKRSLGDPIARRTRGSQRTLQNSRRNGKSRSGLCRARRGFGVRWWTVLVRKFVDFTCVVK